MLTREISSEWQPCEKMLDASKYIEVFQAAYLRHDLRIASVVSYSSRFVTSEMGDFLETSPCYEVSAKTKERVFAF